MLSAKLRHVPESPRDKLLVLKTKHLQLWINAAIKLVETFYHEIDNRKQKREGKGNRMKSKYSDSKIGVKI